jgi:hypothetical protein
VAKSWVPLPTEILPDWHELRLTARLMCSELYRISADNDGPVPIRCVGDWRRTVCRLLQLHGKDRANACKALDEIREAGLLTVGEGWVLLHFHRHPERQSVGTPSAVHSHSVGTPPALRIESTVENHSLDDPQIRSEENKIREESESARARLALVYPEPDPDEPDPPRPTRLARWGDMTAAHAIETAFVKRFEQDGGGGSPVRKYVSKMAIELAPWLESTARVKNTTEPALLSSLLDRFFTDENAKSKGFPPGFLASNPNEYLTPQPTGTAANMNDTPKPETAALLEELKAEGRALIARRKDPTIDEYEREVGIENKLNELRLKISRIESAAAAKPGGRRER